MIKHYIPNTNKCWGVSRQTHLTPTGDTDKDRIAGNRVMLQIEDLDQQKQPGDEGYARRTFSVDEGLSIAGALVAAATACLLSGPSGRAVFDGCHVHAENGEVVIDLKDMVGNQHAWCTISMPPEEALNMACMAANTAVGLIDRIISPAPAKDGGAA